MGPEKHSQSTSFSMIVFAERIRIGMLIFVVFDTLARMLVTFSTVSEFFVDLKTRLLCHAIILLMIGMIVSMYIVDYVLHQRSTQIVNQKLCMLLNRQRAS